MIPYPSKLLVSLVIAATLTTCAFAQKVSVGYDKSAEFVKYSSYTWAEPATPPTKPLLYMNIVGAIDHEMKAKGLATAGSNSDLILAVAGGTDLGINYAAGTPIISSNSGPPPAIDASMWTGAGGSSNLSGLYFQQGTLTLSFVERSTNKVIWSGTVTQDLDWQNKKKSLVLVDKAIVKLMKQYPPKKK
jgi:uncharacterized protein DUF4136